MRHTKQPGSAFAILIVILAASITAWWHAPEAFCQTPVRTGQTAEAEALIRAGHWKRARGILEPRVKANPDDPQTCYLLAEVRMAFKDLDAALPLARHAVDIDGRNSNYHLELGRVYGEMADRASFISAGSLAVKFRKEVEVAISLDPKNLDALDAMMQFKYQAPGIMGGSKDEANALAEKITALNPSEGYLAHAELAELAKDPAQMESFYLKAVHANAGSYDAQTSLAKFYSQPAHPKYEEATKHAQIALRLDPKRVEAYWILARVFSLQQKWADLEQTLSSAEKAVPDDLRPLYEAAEGLLESGQDFHRVEGYARQYLSQEPEGEEPDGADGHRLLGLVLEKEGRSPDARMEIQTALRLRPSFKAAKEDLKRLGG